MQRNEARVEEDFHLHEWAIRQAGQKNNVVSAPGISWPQYFQTCSLSFFFSAEGEKCRLQDIPMTGRSVWGDDRQERAAGLADGLGRDTLARIAGDSALRWLPRTPNEGESESEREGVSWRGESESE